MMAPLLLLLADATPPIPAATDWPSLPLLVRQRPAPIPVDVFVFVRDEVDAGRCDAVTVDASGTSTLRVPAVALVDPRGGVGAVVPGTIGCPAVERYTADVVARSVAHNVRRPWPVAPAWYRTAMTYSWTRPVLRSR